MTNATIPLAKGYNAAKQNFPGFLSVKLDGIPCRIDFDADAGTFAVRTRQGKAMPSVERQAGLLVASLYDAGCIRNGKHTFVGEVTHKTLKDFKDAGGVIRRQTQQEDLKINLFDYTADTTMDMDFGQRLIVLVYLMQHLNHEDFSLCPQYHVEYPAQYEGIKAELIERFPGAEGLVWRGAQHRFEPGKRSNDYMRVLDKPTADLLVVGYEEAIDKEGNPKGMVGRINVQWKMEETVGVGPGKMTHAERTKVWQEYIAAGRNMPGGPRLCQVEYKRDPAYTAMREPTWQMWRTDKDEVSYE